MQQKKDVWFPAMKYGVGWGLPVSWQGWVILIGYLLVIIGGAVAISDIRDLLWFLPLVGVSSVLFVFTCWKKGEKLGLRWGDKIK